MRRWETDRERDSLDSSPRLWYTLLPFYAPHPLHLSHCFFSFLFSFVCQYKHTCLVLAGLTRRGDWQVHWGAFSQSEHLIVLEREREREREHWQTVQRFKCHSSYLSTSECVFNPYHCAAASTHRHTHTDQRPKQIYLLWAPLYYFFPCLTHRNGIICRKWCDKKQNKRKILQDAIHNFKWNILQLLL